MHTQYQGSVQKIVEKRKKIRFKHHGMSTRMGEQTCLIVCRFEHVCSKPFALRVSAFSNSSQPEHLTGSNIFLLLTHFHKFTYFWLIFSHSFHKSDLESFAQALTLALQDGTNLLSSRLYLIWKISSTANKLQIQHTPCLICVLTQTVWWQDDSNQERTNLIFRVSH